MEKRLRFFGRYLILLAAFAVAQFVSFGLVGPSLADPDSIATNDRTPWIAKVCSAGFSRNVLQDALPVTPVTDWIPPEGDTTNWIVCSTGLQDGPDDETNENGKTKKTSQTSELTDRSANSGARSKGESQITSNPKVAQEKRLAMVGAVALTVIGSIAILFVYFRLNLATRGFYAGRLQTLATLLLLALFGFVVWFVRTFAL